MRPIAPPKILEIRHVSGKLPLSAVHQLMIEHVEHEFEVRGVIKPTWLVLAQKRLLFMTTDWNNDEEKVRYVHATEAFLKYFEAEAYSFACEAWVTSYSKEEMDEAKRKGERLERPSERDPKKRDDICFITTYPKKGDGLMRRYIVNIKPPLKNMLGVAIDVDDYKMGGGLLFNLFDLERARNEKELEEREKR